MILKTRALAIDLDGTLMTPDDRVSERTARALTAAREAGIEIVIATARWYQLAQRVADPLGLDGPIIACSGAEVRRLADGADLMDVRLPDAFTRAVFEICDQERCIVWAPFEERVLLKAEGEIHGAPPEVDPVARLSDAVKGEARMVLVQGTGARERVLSELRDRFASEVRFFHSITTHGKSMLTLTATAAHKGVALQRACAELGVAPEETVAFGDAENDLELFRAAGRSFAMGQASDAVKAAATDVTASNAEDGVAVAVERLLAVRS